MIATSYGPGTFCSIYGCHNDRGTGVCCIEHRRDHFHEQDALAAAERVLALAQNPAEELAAAKLIAVARVALNDLHEKAERETGGNANREEIAKRLSELKVYRPVRIAGRTVVVRKIGKFAVDNLGSSAGLTKEEVLEILCGEEKP